MIFGRAAKAGRKSPLYEAESLAAAVPALLLEAATIARMMRSGEHGRRRSGEGDSFWQFRPYQAGDEASKIDWRRSARGETLYVREKEWATAAVAHLWADASPSMRWRSNRRWPEKARRALVLATALGFLLVEAGEAVCFMGSMLPPATDAKGIVRLLEEKAALPPDAALPAPPERRGKIVLVSDFLFDPGETERAIAAIAATGCKTHLLHLLDPAEQDWEWRGRILFSGTKGEDDTLVAVAEDLRESYRNRMESFRLGLAETARRKGWSFQSGSTGRPPLGTLAALCNAVGGL